MWSLMTTGRTLSCIAPPTLQELGNATCNFPKEAHSVLSRTESSNVQTIPRRPECNNVDAQGLLIGAASIRSLLPRVSSSFCYKRGIGSPLSVAHGADESDLASSCDERRATSADPRTKTLGIAAWRSWCYERMTQGL